MKKRHAGVVLAIAGGLAGIAYLAYRWRASDVDWNRFIAAFTHVDWAWLALSAVLILASYAGRALRWEVMLRPLPAKTSFKGILAATCIGFTAVVLFGRAGEPVRPYLISRGAGVSFSSQVAAWVVERILDLLMILVIFGIALTQVSHSEIRSGPRVQTALRAGGGFAGIVGVLCLALFFGLRHFRGRVQDRLMEGLAFLPQRFLTRVESFFRSFGEGMESVRSSSGTLLLVVYTILEWAVVAGAFYCAFRSFPATAGLRVTDIVIVLGFICFGSVLQIPGVGGGMQIVTVLILTEFYGIGLAAATGFALLWWAVSFLTIVPIGLTMAFRKGIKWRNLRNIDTDLETGSPGGVQ